jgi:hypothetical protein
MPGSASSDTIRFSQDKDQYDHGQDETHLSVHLEVLRSDREDRNKAIHEGYEGRNNPYHQTVRNIVLHVNLAPHDGQNPAPSLLRVPQCLQNL